MSLDKLITHSKRYDLVAQRLSDNHQKISESDNLTIEQCIDHMKLMEEGLEALADIAADYNEIIIEREKVNAFQANALRLYAKKFGLHQIMERDMPDGIPFKIDITILPITDRYMSVDINIEDGEYEHKHNRGRTSYQKIRDWFILLRQSLRKP